MLTDDGPDGVDCAAWIGKQPWSDGQIGMIGTSYFGGTQHAMAMAGAPELKTVIPVDAMANWIFLNASNGSRAGQDPGTKEVLKEMADQRHTYLQNLPTRRGMTPLRLAPEYEDWLISAMENGPNDEFWEQNNIVDAPHKYKDIPV